MILIDTNVLVALVLRKDRLHDRAVKHLEKHAKEELGIPSVVLCETCFLLASRPQRARLRELVVAIGARQVSEPRQDEVFDWLERYGDHDPDWVDACLVVLCGKEHRVWTYDKEFQTIWRRRDGGRVRLLA